MNYRPLTRLQRGMVVSLRGEQWRVTMVNECRAHCVQLNREEHVVRDGLRGVTKRFLLAARTIDISPNSEVEVL